jgi:hypothetical protein
MVVNSTTSVARRGTSRENATKTPGTTSQKAMSANALIFDGTGGRLSYERSEITL